MPFPVALRPVSLVSRLRTARLRWNGVTVGPDTIIERGVDCRPAAVGTRRGIIQIGGRCHLSRGLSLHAFGGRITLAENVFLGPNVVIYGHGGVEIGANTLVAMHCRIVSSNHTVPPPGTLIRSQPDIPLPTRIGRDVWLGAGVTVLGGVTIGDGCVIGAGAVVTRDLPPNSIAYGIPASVRQQRR
ncbi:MAG: acyltransferase [Undibacterium sp.]|nr:acyltransferase [Opitutaceae bacterium]